MDDTVQIRCTRCKSAFRERARRLQPGYSRQCPNCEVIIFFEESSSDKNVQTALLEARRLRRMLRVPWFLATSEDFRYPKTEGRAMNGGIAFMQRCIDHVIRRSVVDRRAYDAFVSIMHMTRGPEALLMPSAIWGALGPAPRV